MMVKTAGILCSAVRKSSANQKLFPAASSYVHRNHTIKGRKDTLFPVRQTKIFYQFFPCPFLFAALAKQTAATHWCRCGYLFVSVCLILQASPRSCFRKTPGNPHLLLCLFFDPPGHIERVVSDDHMGSCPLHADHIFHDNLLLINPAV